MSTEPFTVQDSKNSAICRMCIMDKGGNHCWMCGNPSCTELENTELLCRTRPHCLLYQSDSTVHCIPAPPEAEEEAIQSILCRETYRDLQVQAHLRWTNGQQKCIPWSDGARVQFVLEKIETKPLRVKNKNKHPEKQVIEPAAGMREQRYQWHRHTLNPVQKVHFEDWTGNRFEANNHRLHSVLTASY